MPIYTGSLDSVQGTPLTPSLEGDRPGERGKGQNPRRPSSTGLLRGLYREGRPLLLFPPLRSRKFSFAHETDPFNRHQGPNLHKPHTKWPQTCGVYANPHTPRPRITEYGLCTLVKSFTNLHPMEASPHPMEAFNPQTGLATRGRKKLFKAPRSLWGYLTPSLFVPGGL